MSDSPLPVDVLDDAAPVYCTARAHIALVLLLAGMTPAERKACSRVCVAWRAAASDPAAWASLSAGHRGFCTAAGATSERAAVDDCDFCAAAAAAADEAASPEPKLLDYRRSHARRNLLSPSKCKSAVSELALTEKSIILLLAGSRLVTVWSPFHHASLCKRRGRRCPHGRGAPATSCATGWHCRCSALQLPPGAEVQLLVQPVPLLGLVSAALGRACQKMVCKLVGLQARPDSTLEAVLPRLRGVLQLGCGDVVQNSEAAGDAAATLDAPGLLGGFESVARAEWAFIVELQQTMTTTEAEEMRQAAAHGMQACEQVAASAAELAEQEAHMHALASDLVTSLLR